MNLIVLITCFIAIVEVAITDLDQILNKFDLNNFQLNFIYMSLSPKRK